MLRIDIAQPLHTVDGPRTLALRLDVAAGEVIALYGPSGVGKTTLLRLLAGLQAPAQGRIMFRETLWADSAQRVHLPPPQRRVGFMFQDYALFPHLSVRANLAFGQRQRNEALIEELLALTGLSALAERKPPQLSGGQRQRVALARALACEPQLLLLDEPLAALDIALREQLQEDLATLRARFRISTVLVSHDLGEVFRLADRVVWLEPGAVRGIGAPREVLLGPSAAGRFTLAGQVLTIDSNGITATVTLAVAGDLVSTLITAPEAASLRVGQRVRLRLHGAGAELLS